MNDIIRDLESEVARLTAELAECRRLLLKHGDHVLMCPECEYIKPGHRHDCAWKKAIGEA